MGAGADRIGVHHESAAEENVRHRYEVRPLIDRREQLVAIDGNAIVRSNNYNSRPEPLRHLLIRVAHRREVELGNARSVPVWNADAEFKAMRDASRKGQ